METKEQEMKGRDYEEVHLFQIRAILYYTILFYTILYYPILSSPLLDHAMLYMLYYTIRYYYTILVINIRYRHHHLQSRPKKIIFETDMELMP